MGEQEAELNIHFEGQSYQMDVDTLITSLLHLTEILKLVSTQTMPDEHLQIKIAAPERGSFSIHLALSAAQVSGMLFPLLPSDLLSRVLEIIAAVGLLLQIKAFLKGEKPDAVKEKGDNQVEIQKGNTTIIINQSVYNIYANNPEVNQHLEKVFDTLIESPEIEGLLVESQHIKPFHASRDEFPGLSRPNQIISELNQTQILKREKADLVVLKLVFQKNRKWEFIYNGNKISAFIEDDVFWNDVENGEIRFTKGDRLLVDLEIAQEYEPEINIYVNKGYAIKEVLDHKQKAIQTKLFDE